MTLMSCPLLAHEALHMTATAPRAKSALCKKHCGPHGARGHKGHRGKHGHPGSTGAKGAPGAPGIFGFAFTPANLWATDTSEFFLQPNNPTPLAYNNVFLDQNIVPVGTAPYSQFQIINTGTYQVNFLLSTFLKPFDHVIITLYVNGVSSGNTIGTNPPGDDAFLQGAYLVQLNAGDIISLIATSINQQTTIGDTSSLNAWNRYIGVIRSS